tara:strand:+ start:2067 stop:2489 length:423 start_codon:yes stop_codon:yes gene_type:complete
MKVGRGQKRCGKCRTVNAARQRVCVYCRQEFIMKNVPLKHEIKDWQRLENGDAFRVINGTGPYYVLREDSHEGKEGEKLFIGCKGKYIVDNIVTEGIGAWKMTAGNSRYEFVYMGKDIFDKSLSIYREAHRIVKINNKRR